MTNHNPKECCCVECCLLRQEKNTPWEVFAEGQNPASDDPLSRHKTATAAQARADRLIAATGRYHYAHYVKSSGSQKGG